MPVGPSFADVREAQARIAHHIHRTPVMRSASLDGRAGARLFFKCENFQKTGSFKIRGAMNAIFALSSGSAARGVVTHSSGNHGAAVAYAARRRGIPSWIVVPRGAPEVKQKAIADFGATIVSCDNTLESRQSTAKALLEETGAALIHPYDNDFVIAGQATAAVELLEEAGELDLMLAPVSGGGLLSGTAIASQSLYPEIRVIGCEPSLADDAFRSLSSGQLQKNSCMDTIADGLRASLSERTYAILRPRVDAIALISEAEILDAMRFVWERMKLLIEPSSAVAVAGALFGKVSGEGKRIGVLLSGGNVDVGRFFERT
ncbi:MAG TPA: pyridoxal-phosphate dependent enzyme [Candidatus Dormibacteraeota bacterium]|nr:pyridoxal-phosphate dependent enzyme [Candidatus Dormibacteraeota bacterium]